MDPEGIASPPPGRRQRFPTAYSHARSMDVHLTTSRTVRQTSRTASAKVPLRACNIPPGERPRRIRSAGRTEARCVRRAADALDPAATEDDLAVIQDARLARGRGPDGLVGFDDPAAA